MRNVLVAMSENALDMLLHLIDKVSHTHDPFYTKEEIEKLYGQLAQLKEDLYRDRFDEEEDEIDFTHLEKAYDNLTDILDLLDEENIDTETIRDKVTEAQELIWKFVKDNFPDAIE